MSSETYFPKPVKAVAIPKKSGENRNLGIPTLEDRVAQMVAKIYFEPNVEKIFHKDSYGYRPNKSAIQAVEVLRERWLKIPFKRQDGTIVERTAGTPQGGVISPVFANLLMHYVFDDFMNKEFTNIPWVKYADDGILKCVSIKQAKYIIKALDKSFKTFGLELNLSKTKIVYCKDNNRKGTYENQKFDFLGYTFRSRVTRKKNGKVFIGFLPTMSDKAQKEIKRKIREQRIQDMAHLNLKNIAKRINKQIQGWINYYTQYYKTGIYDVLKYINRCLIKLVVRKIKKI